MMKPVIETSPMKLTIIFLTALIGSAAFVHADERYSVRVPIANIRSGPGTGYSVLWKVEKNHPLNIVQVKGSWCRFIDFEGDKGWIYKSLIDTVPSIIIVKDNCNIRSGAGRDYPVKYTSDRGVPYQVLERKDGWIHIQHADGDKGWIHGDLAW